MDMAELEAVLLGLDDSSYNALIGKVTTERRRRMYAAYAAAQLPGEIAHHDAHLADHLPASPFCRDFEDGLDGYTVHAAACPNWPKSWLSGSGCLRQGFRR